MGLKCISCNTDNTAKDRQSYAGRCKNCGHSFVFELTTINGRRITDKYFASCLATISSQDTLYFTESQFFYFLQKRLGKVKNAKFNLIFPGVMLTLIGGITIPDAILRLCAVILGIVVILLGFNSTGGELDALSQEQFKELMRRWQKVNLIPKMLPKVTADLKPVEINSEILAYSFDKAVICYTDAIAQMLIANNFHFENNCAILSINGYPQGIFGSVMQMLRRNPDLKVYALHDASPDGIKLPYILQTSNDWFANDSATVYQLGMLPRQVIKNRKLPVQVSANSTLKAQQIPPEVRQSLSTAELKWLEEGKFLELESFSPRKIIQILNQGMARSQNSPADSLVEIDGDRYYVDQTFSFG